ncbi:MAG: nucleotidyl transferase AbiEii/AbiGii toxin family protein [Thermodesulfobacteriota bacterium]|nr:nucleotidyl transferase AbiEii/AbiGii toxin family protein [Thermodesulfobacteriota bacterium]
MRADIKNLSASIHARLNNKAKENKRLFQETFQYYAMERFLYRLSKSRYQDRFVLKGALMFTVWDVPFRRPTRDIDLKGYVNNDVNNIEKIIKEICEQPVEPDGMVFNPESVQGEIIQEVATYQGVRVKFRGFLGKAWAPLQLDIGFVDEITPAAVDLEYPVLLGANAPLLKGYPPETVIAEKLHSIVFLGESNSRLKDFYDVWLLSRQYDFEGKQLSEAIQKTFKQRETAIPEKVPVGLTDAFVQKQQIIMWKNILSKISGDTSISTDFGEVVGQIREFLLPILDNLGEQKYLQLDWSPGKGWG